MKRLLQHIDPSRNQLAVAGWLVLPVLLIASIALAQPRGALPPANAQVGSTAKWSITAFADGKAISMWQADAVEYMGHGVFSFRSDDHRDVMVSGTVIVEANW